MTCCELADFLAEYVEGMLPADTHRAFEAHLSVCPDCRKYVDSYRKTMHLSKSAMRGPASVDDVPEELVAAILKAKRVASSS